MSHSMLDLIFYIPIHSNFAQIENVVPFMDRFPAKVFIFNWNTSAKKMNNYFSNLNKGGRQIQAFEFSVENIVSQAETEDKTIVVLLTSSTNYGFGRAQADFFTCLKKLYPEKVVDIFTTGHCMYGCDSCGLREHNIPLFFTRYFTKTLAYDSHTVLRYFNTSSLAPKVVISPSVGEKSFLSIPNIVNWFVAQKKSNFFLSNVVVKLHGFCFSDDTLEQPHPLSGLTALERENVKILSENFKVVAEEHHNILPFLEVCDFVISDLDSSVCFESLYFPHSKILAYSSKEILDAYDDHLYLGFFNTFSNTNDLQTLFSQNGTEIKTVGPNAKAFFEEKYTKVDGNEVEAICKLRKWDNVGVSTTASTTSESVSNVTEKINQFNHYLKELVPDPSPLEYLARGTHIPEDSILFALFAQDHLDQLQARGVPKRLWKRLYHKISDEIFDLGDVLQFLIEEEEEEEEGENNDNNNNENDDEKNNNITQQNEEENNENNSEIEEVETNDVFYRPRTKRRVVVSKENGLDAFHDIYLIDHAWSTTVTKAKEELHSIEALLERVENLMELPNEGKGKEERIETVLNEQWKWNETYRMGAEKKDEEVSIWYFMDELGMSIAHSRNPSVMIVPFYYAPKGISYSLLWPISHVPQNSSISRDFLHSFTTVSSVDSDELEVQRAAKISIYFGLDEDDKMKMEERLEKYLEKLTSVIPPVVKVTEIPRVEQNKKLPLKVWSDLDLVKKNLTWKEKFTFADNIEEADVVWFTTETPTNPLTAPNQMVNAFENESCITFKNRVVESVTSTFGLPDWMPLTFNLLNHTPEFIGQYLRVQKMVSPNIWIVKPWNYARGKDIIVTDNMECVIRQQEAGPRIVSRYLHNPLLYEGRKFDLRYIIMVKHTYPEPEVYAFKMFWIRLANEQFSLDNFDCYEKHFTVMNYSKYKMQQLLYTDFIKNVEQQYPTLNWENVQKGLYQVMKSVIVAGAKNPPPEGLGRSQNQRSIYGFDMMITDKFSPILIECNFSPDCTRACNYDPDFYNKIFSVLFTDDWMENEGVRNSTIPI